MGANVIGDSIYNSGTLTLDTCTLYGSNNVPFGGSSGGIENLGTATITDCVFINSKGKPSTSGGVRNWGNLYVSGTEFNNCRETTYYGSAISNRGGYVEILSSDFHDNVGYGGTVYNSNDGSGNSGLIEIDGTTFTDNQAGGGGRSGTPTATSTVPTPRSTATRGPKGERSTASRTRRGSP